MDKLKIIFMGTPDFGVPALEKLSEHFNIIGVFTQPDRKSGRGLKTVPCPVKNKAVELGFKVFQPDRLAGSDEAKVLLGLAPDFVVVAAYGQILKKDILDLPRLGCVNIHSSLLPRWRGAAPIQWAILEGDSETGVRD